MDGIDGMIAQLVEIKRRDEEFRMSYRALVKDKEELLLRLSEADQRYDTMYNCHQREREAKLKAIMNLKEAKREQERVANIKFNQLKEEMSMMVSRFDHERVLTELEALKEENSKLRKSRNDLIVQSTLGHLKPEEILLSQVDLSPPSEAFASGFSLPEKK